MSEKLVDAIVNMKEKEAVQDAMEAVSLNMGWIGGNENEKDS